MTGSHPDSRPVATRRDHPHARNASRTSTRPLDEADDRVRSAIADAREVVLCLDFDGTLAPIVDDPAAAEPLPEAAEAVRSLAEVPDVTTAIVSGRALADVRGRIDGPSIYAGNHGLEIERNGSVAVHPIATKRASLVDEVCERLDRRFAPIPDCRVENKRLTGTVHVRSVPEETREDVVAETERTVAAVGDGALSSSRGKRVIEFAPDIPWGKGNAVELIESIVTPDRSGESESVTIYVGDDTTDESAFRSVEPDGIGVRVGSARSSDASRHVESPRDVADLLRGIETVASE